MMVSRMPWQLPLAMHLLKGLSWSGALPSGGGEKATKLALALALQQQNNDVSPLRDLQWWKATVYHTTPQPSTRAIAAFETMNSNRK